MRPTKSRLILFLVVGLILAFLWGLLFYAGVPVQHPSDIRLEHTEYKPLVLPYDLTKLSPNYLGYHLDKYDKLKNCKVSDWNGSIDKVELDSIFEETIFDNFSCTTDKEKYLEGMSLGINLQYRDSLQINQKIKIIFTSLKKTYGDNYTVYEFIYPLHEIANEYYHVCETIFCIYWNVNNNSVYFQFGLIDRRNPLTNKIIAKYGNSYLEKKNSFGVLFCLDDDGEGVNKDKWFFQKKSWQESKKSEYIIKYLNSIQKQ